MVLLLMLLAGGLLAILAALILQLKLPGYMLLAGLFGKSREKLANIDIRRLSHGSSVLYYLLGGSLLLGSVLLGLKTISELIALPASFVCIFAVFNAMHFYTKRCDRNPRSVREHRGSVFLYACMNIILILLFLLYLH